jgi:subtilisin family serine protease
MGSDGSGYYSDIIEGTIWAADNGADIMNFSIGGEGYSQALEDALEYAFNKDIVSACSSGNEAVSGVVFPAAYDAYALAVGGSDYNDLLYTESNYGPELDVAAPAVRILSCVPLWYWGPDSFPYAYGFGTSSAAPQVAGLAALIKSIKPWLTADEIMNVIRVTADDVNSEEHPGYDEYFGYGRINMEKALVPIKITK